jgi:hypothetical protein
VRGQTRNGRGAKWRVEQREAAPTLSGASAGAQAAQEFVGLALVRRGVENRAGREVDVQGLLQPNDQLSSTRCAFRGEVEPGGRMQQEEQLVHVPRAAKCAKYRWRERGLRAPILPGKVLSGHVLARAVTIVLGATGKSPF